MAIGGLALSAGLIAGSLHFSEGACALSADAGAQTSSPIHPELRKSLIYGHDSATCCGRIVMEATSEALPAALMLRAARSVTMQSPAQADEFVRHSCLRHLSMTASSSVSVFVPATCHSDQSHRRAR